MSEHRVPQRQMPRSTWQKEPRKELDERLERWRRVGNKGKVKTQRQEPKETPPPYRGNGIEAPVAKRKQSLLNEIVSRCAFSESGCWEWTAAKCVRGYGRFKYDGKLVLPHRVVAYCVGKISAIDGKDRKQCVLHDCDNPKCCNPDHLSAGSLSRNMRDCSERGRHGSRKLKGKPMKRRSNPAAKP